MRTLELRTMNAKRILKVNLNKTADEKQQQASNTMNTTQNNNNNPYNLIQQWQTAHLGADASRNSSRGLPLQHA
jgi:hypothetical protein